MAGIGTPQRVVRLVIAHNDDHGDERPSYVLRGFDAEGHLVWSDSDYAHPPHEVSDRRSPRRWAQEWAKRALGRDIPFDWRASRFMTRGRGACVEVNW